MNKRDVFGQGLLLSPAGTSGGWLGGTKGETKEVDGRDQIGNGLLSQTQVWTSYFGQWGVN